MVNLPKELIGIPKALGSHNRRQEQQCIDRLKDLTNHPQLNLRPEQPETRTPHSRLEPLLEQDAQQEPESAVPRKTTSQNEEVGYNGCPQKG